LTDGSVYDQHKDILIYEGLSILDLPEIKLLILKARRPDIIIISTSFVKKDFDGLEEIDFFVTNV